jgi:hypothetical protein
MDHVAPRPPRPPIVEPGRIDHHVSDLTVTSSADLTLGSLQQSLATHDQWLPMDGNPQHTLGDLIQANSTGPLRLGFGAWRDLLLGMQFTTRGGTLITAGGRTMKNVAGYDLTKFMVGQHGLFGKVVTLTTRTYTRPTAALLVKFEPSDRLIGQLLPASARPQWAMLANGFLWCGYFGDERAIAFHESNMQTYGPIETKRQTLAEDIEFRAAQWLPDRPPLRFRVSVPPARVLEFMRQVTVANSAADAAFGVVVGSVSADRKEPLRKLTGDFGGTIVVDEPDERRSFFGASSGVQELLRGLESAFTG